MGGFAFHFQGHYWQITGRKSRSHSRVSCGFLVAFSNWLWLECAMEQKPISKADRKAEQKICGFHACMALFHNRPQDIIRAYVTEGTRKAFGSMLKFCAETRLAYHIVEPADLAKIAESDHTEGVCILAKMPKHPDFNTFLKNSAELTSPPPSDAATASDLRPHVVLWLVGVENPHNVGAILRSAAHFGVAAVLVTPATPSATASPSSDGWRLSGAAIRIAEGGAEHVPVIVAPGSVADTARDLKRKGGFMLYATTGNPKAHDIWTTEIKHPCVIALGAEGAGLPDIVLKSADATLRLAGTGKVESLNVSVAAGVIAAAATRIIRESQ